MMQGYIVTCFNAGISVFLFRAGAQSLATENANRLAAM
jgi:hypothetical protein